MDVEAGDAQHARRRTLQQLGGEFRSVVATLHARPDRAAHAARLAKRVLWECEQQLVREGTAIGVVQRLTGFVTGDESASASAIDARIAHLLGVQRSVVAAVHENRYLRDAFYGRATGQMHTAAASAPAPATMATVSGKDQASNSELIDITHRLEHVGMLYESVNDLVQYGDPLVTRICSEAGATGEQVSRAEQQLLLRYGGGGSDNWLGCFGRQARTSCALHAACVFCTFAWTFLLLS